MAVEYRKTSEPRLAYRALCPDCGVEREFWWVVHSTLGVGMVRCEECGTVSDPDPHKLKPEQ